MNDSTDPDNRPSLLVIAAKENWMYLPLIPISFLAIWALGEVTSLFLPNDQVIDSTFQEHLIALVVWSIFAFLVCAYWWTRENSERFEKPLNENWSTRAMERALSKLDTMKNPQNQPLIDYHREDNEDVTEESWYQIFQFMPYIEVHGVDLAFERGLVGRHAIWGGVFVRALQKVKSRMCLQYVIVYTRQLSAVSIIWWVLIPLIMAYLNWYLQSMGYWLIILLFSALPVISILTHLTDSTSKLRIHQTTPLSVFWLILFLGQFDWIWPSLILSLMGGLFLCLWIFDLFEVKIQGRPLYRSGHPMDYIPIFVWIEQIDGEWYLSRVYWDKWHYLTGMKTEFKERELYNECRVRFVIDNPWHSLRLGKSFWSKQWYQVGIILAVILLFISQIAIPTIDMFFSSILAIVLSFVVLSSVLDIIYQPLELLPKFEKEVRSTIGRRAYYRRFKGGTLDSVFYPEMYEADNEDIERIRKSERFIHLSDKKSVSNQWSNLHILWNLKRKGTEWEEEGPKLVVVKKLQDPFKYEEYMTTFRNENEDID